MNTRMTALTMLLVLAAIATGAQTAPVTIHVGYFPNTTHSQALVGKATGKFEQGLGSGVRVDWKAFNADPSAIEALFDEVVFIIP